MAGVAVAASRASRGRSSSPWCSCARGPRSPSVPVSGAGPPSRFPHSRMPAVSVSQGPPPRSPLPPPQVRFFDQLYGGAEPADPPAAPPTAFKRADVDAQKTF